MTLEFFKCLEEFKKTYAIWILPFDPTGMLLRCWTQRSTATESPICTIAVPSLVFKNFIYITKERRCVKLIQTFRPNSFVRRLTLATLPYRHTILKSLSVFDVSLSRPYTIMTAPCGCDWATKLVGPLRAAIGGSFIRPGPGVGFQLASAGGWNSEYGGNPAPGPSNGASWNRICLKEYSFSIMSAQKNNK